MDELTDFPANHPLWRDGVFVPADEAVVGVNAVGHASVSASFEGIHSYRADDGGLNVFRLREHMARLLDSIRLAYLSTGFTVDDLVAATVELLRRNDARGDTYVRPWCFARGTHREQMVPEGSPVEIVIDVWPFRTKLGTPRTATAAVTSWARIGTGVFPPRIKAFSNYHNGRLGNIEARARGADWPIFLNASHLVTESSGANVAIVRGGRVHTPPTSSGIMEGITRDTLLTLLDEDLGTPAVVRDIERSELYVADEVFFLGTAAEVLPITRVDGHVVGDGGAGPVTRLLAGTYHDVVRARGGARAEWLTPVWD